MNEACTTGLSERPIFSLCIGTPYAKEKEKLRLLLTTVTTPRGKQRHFLFCIVTADYSTCRLNFKTSHISKIMYPPLRLSIVNIAHNLRMLACLQPETRVSIRLINVDFSPFKAFLNICVEHFPQYCKHQFPKLSRPAKRMDEKWHTHSSRISNTSFYFHNFWQVCRYILLSRFRLHGHRTAANINTVFQNTTRGTPYTPSEQEFNIAVDKECIKLRTPPHLKHFWQILQIFFKSF